MLTMKLAWRNLFRNTRRTVLTVILIAFSLAALIITDGLLIGISELMTRNITHTLAGEAQIHRRGFLENNDAELYISDPAPIIEKLTSNDAVLDYAPRVMLGGMITSSYNVSGGFVYGVDSEREIAVSKIRTAIVEGMYLSGEARQILVGKPMAELLEVSLHDRIVLTLSDPKSGEILQGLFRLSGIVEFGVPELDANVVFINLQEAQILAGLDQGLHQIAVRFNHPQDASRQDHDLYQSISNDDVEALSWHDFNPQIASLVEYSTYATLVVGIILFFLASLGVINSMFMSIYERIYEFGVARALGATPGSIWQLVMLEALLIAVCSCIAGNLIGYSGNSWFAANGLPIGEFELSGLMLQDGIHTRVVADQFIQYPVYIILLTLVAAVYPAMFAARIVPSEALQRSL